MVYEAHSNTLDARRYSHSRESSIQEAIMYVCNQILRVSRKEYSHCSSYTHLWTIGMRGYRVCVCVCVCLRVWKLHYQNALALGWQPGLKYLTKLCVCVCVCVNVYVFWMAPVGILIYLCQQAWNIYIYIYIYIQEPCGQPRHRA